MYNWSSCLGLGYIQNMTEIQFKATVFQTQPLSYRCTVVHSVWAAE